MPKRVSDQMADKNRIEAFSDAVIAIIMTLLVLEIRVPEHLAAGDLALWNAVFRMLPIIGSWVVSFVFVLIFWVAHHYLFARIERVDRNLLWLNGLFLLFLAFTPFPTALNAAYPGSTPAAFILSLTMFLSASSFSMMRLYVLRNPALANPKDAKHHLHAYARGLISPLLYALAMVLSFAWLPGAITIQIIVPLFYFFPGKGPAIEED
jgi:uncharacterized membrane protein